MIDRVFCPPAGRGGVRVRLGTRQSQREAGCGRGEPWALAMGGSRGSDRSCGQEHITRGYVLTKALDDFGLLTSLPAAPARIMRIPAALLCYWMGASELGVEE